MRAEHTSVRPPAAEERGIALIAALMIMLLMSALMIGFTTVVMSDQRYRGIDKDRTRAYYGAQSGLEKLTTDLGNLFLDNVAPTNAQIAALGNNPPSIPSVTFVAPAGVTAYGVTPVACLPPSTFTCSGQILNGPYQGLIALKKTYNLDSVARTSSGGEAHLMRKMESVAIPVFQFGTFSDVDLAFFAGPNFNFGGRVHTNGNLFLAEGGGNSLTLQDKVTAVKDVIRQVMQNGVAITNAPTHDGTINMATSTNSFRPMQATEGSLQNGLGSSLNSNWQNISLGSLYYNGYIRNGGVPDHIDKGTGAKVLNLPVITVGGANTDLSRRPVLNPPEDPTSVLFGERDFGKVSLRILLSDKAADMTGLATVTGNAPISLANWSAANGGAPPAGYTIDATHPPVALAPGPVTMTTSANTAADGNIQVLGVPPPGWPYHSPVITLTSNAVPPVTLATIVCATMTTVAPIQFQNCYNAANLATNIPPLPNPTIFTMSVNGVVVSTSKTSTSTAGTNKSYTVGSTANFAAYNTFWFNNTLVTCGWVDATTLVNTTFSNCKGTPATNAPQTIATNSLSAANTGLLDGFIKIERQDTGGNWNDVTLEILNYGITGPNQSGVLCNGNANAILYLQRYPDVGVPTVNPAFAACPYTGSTNPYDYWPNALFDTREALMRDTAPASGNIVMGGVMHYVALNVTNLRQWFAATGAYAGGTGANSLTNNGYSVYFSDRRNNRNAGGLETGEYGFEDIVNPLNAAGTPNGALDGGEDVNANNTLDVYGQFPSSAGTANSLPAGGVGIYNPANLAIPASTVRPTQEMTFPQAMVNRPYLFRRALKLVNGSLGNIPMPGFTVVTENPVYVQGDWNANQASTLSNYGDPHSETSLVADAVTLLSNSWTDTNSFVNPYNPNNRARNAQSWYRLAVIAGKGMAFPWPAAGNPPNDFGTDGGAHNFLRYLESGGTVNYRGAIATFYFNRQAVGTYKCCNTVYGAPTRNYNFDTDFLDPAKLPPLTPVFRDINALGFAQEIRPGK